MKARKKTTSYSVAALSLLLLSSPLKASYQYPQQQNTYPAFQGMPTYQRPVPQTTQGYQAQGQVQDVTIHLSCKNLPRLDFLSQSDPIVNIYTRQNQGPWQFVTRTEVIKNSHNPKFSTPYFHHMNTYGYSELKFEVIDQDGSAPGHGDMIGEFVLPENLLYQYVGQTYFSQLIYPYAHSSKSRGQIELEITPGIQRQQQASKILVSVSGNNMPKMDSMFGKVDPYLEFYQLGPNGKKNFRYRTNVCKQTYNPNWGQIELDLSELSNNQLNQPFLVEVFDKDSNTKDDFIGSFQMTAQEILNNGYQSYQVQFSDPKIHGKHKHQPTNVIFTAAQLMRNQNTYGNGYNQNQPHQTQYQQPHYQNSQGQYRPVNNNPPPYAPQSMNSGYMPNYQNRY